MRLGTIEVSVPKLVVGAFGLTVVVVVLVAASTSGAAFGAHNVGWEGLSEVRELADDAGVETIVATEARDYEQANPDGTVVLLVGPESTSPEQRARLRTFLEGGGTVVVASQDPEIANPLLRTLGTDVRVDGDRLRDERAHDASANFPLVTSVADHDYVAGAEGMALNHGTALTTDGEQIASPSDDGDGADGPRSLANSSEFSYYDRDGNEILGPEEELASRSVIAHERVGRGEVIAVADPSTFINVMLERQPNRAFVGGVLGAHDRLVLDQTDEDVPPIAASLLLVRTAPAPAILVALALIGVVLAWDRRPHRQVGARWRAWRGRGGSAGPERPLDREAMSSYVADRYPELEDRHRERVLGGIMKDHDKFRNHD